MPNRPSVRRAARPFSRRAFAWTAAAAVVGCLTPSVAHARPKGALPGALPGALDLVPPDAPFIVVVDRPAETVRQLNALLMKMPGESAQQIRLVLGQAMLPLFLPGVDGTDSIAVAVLPPEGMDDAPRIVGIAPIANFELLTTGLGLDVVDGMAQIPPLMGMWAMDLPGPYAAIAADPDMLRALDLAPGQTAAIRERLGEVGLRAVQGAAISAVAEPSALEALVGAGFLGAGPMEVAGGFGIPGADGIDRAISTMVETVLRDGAASVIALTPDDTHITATLATQFRAGSDAGTVFAPASDQSDTSGVAGTLAADRFLLAAAADLSHAPMRAALRDVTGGDEPGPFSAALLPSGQPDALLGWGLVVGRSPAALGGAGILGRTMSLTLTDNPQGEFESRRAAIDALGGLETEALRYAAEREPGEPIDGAAVDRYRVTADASDPDSVADANALAGAQRAFGRSGGPIGFLTAGETGVIATSGRSRGFLGAAFDAAGGVADTPSLVASEGRAEAASRMASPRSFELWVDADATLGLFGQFGQLLFTQFPDGPPESLGMVGVGGVLGDGGARIDIVLTHDAASLFGLGIVEDLGGVLP